MSLDKYIQGQVLTYEQYKNKNVKYDLNTKCFVFDCNKPGLYEGGDARFYCGMCEEHSNLRGRYRLYLGSLVSDAEHLLSSEELYDKAQARINKLKEKLSKALGE